MAGIKVQIDKGIKMPPLSEPPVFPWEELEIGDSFLDASKGGGYARRANEMSLRLGRTFETRRVDGGTRVWRTA